MINGDSPNPGNVPPATTTIRIILNAYNEKDPELWFQVAEYIFESNGINNEADKFSRLLQVLDSQHHELLRAILLDSSVSDKYTQSKKLLINAHAKSKVLKMQEVLSATKPLTSTKPSIVYQQILGSLGVHTDEGIIRTIWIQQLPEKIREFLTVNEDEPIEKQIKLADRLIETFPNTAAPVISAVSAKPATPNHDSLIAIIATLTSKLSELSTKVDAIQVERSRSRSRSHHRYNSRQRSESPYQNPEPTNSTPDLIDGLCWYHYNFNKKARKCVVGCRFQGNSQ